MTTDRSAPADTDQPRQTRGAESTREPERQPTTPSLSDRVTAERASDTAATPSAPTDASATRITTALTELQSGNSERSTWAIEKDLRDTLRQHTSAQITNIEKRLGGSLEQIFSRNTKISEETRQALRVYLKGSDHRSDSDVRSLMDRAVGARNLDLLSEASSIASPAARAQFRENNGDGRVRAAFSSERDLRQAQDLVADGHVGTLTRVWASRSSVWSRFSDEKGIEAALRNMPESERRLYQNGAALASGRNVEGLSAQDADRARQFHRSLNTEIEKSGNPTQVLAWKAMAADGGAELFGKFAAQRGTLWNGSRGDLSTAIEGMSAQDFRYFRDSHHRQERRAAVEQILSSVAGREDVGRLMDQFDRKIRGGDFTQSQAAGQRGILEALNDHTHWYRNDRTAVVDAITRMPPDEQKRYREDANFRRQVDEGVRGVLKSGDSLVEAQRLLDRVRQGEAPTEDIMTKLRKNASTIIGDGAESLRDIQEAFNRDPKLRDSVVNPTADQRGFSQEFRELAARAVGSGSTNRELLDTLLRTGSVPADRLVGLNNGWFTNDYSRAMQDLANMPEAQRQRLLANPTQLQQTIGFMDPARQRAATEVLRQGRMGAEDQIYAAVSGPGHSADVVEALRKLRPEELQRARSEYERKYGGNLETAVREKLTGSELTEANRLLVADRDARTQADQSRNEYYASRTGFGSWFSDAVLRSGTGLTADNAVNQQVRAVTEANRTGNPASEGTIGSAQEQLRAAVDNHRESKEAIASTATDVVIGGVAIGSSIATFGGAVPLWVGVGGTLALGSVARVGGNALFRGNDYDWSAPTVLKDASVGAINAGVSLIGPGQIAGLFGRRLATETAVSQLGWVARTAAFARSEAYNFAAGGAGGVAGEAANGLTQWDPRKTAAENLTNIGTASAAGFLSGGVGAFAIGNAFRIAANTTSAFRSTEARFAARIGEVEPRRQILGNEGGEAGRVLDHHHQQFRAAELRGDEVGARNSLQQIIRTYDREGGLPDAQIAYVRREMAANAFRANDLGSAQRLVTQSMQTLEKFPLENRDMIKALQLQRSIYEHTNQPKRLAEIDERISLLAKRQQWLDSLPPTSPAMDRLSQQMLVIQAARDPAFRPQQLSFSEPVTFNPGMTPRLVTAHTKNGDLRVLVQHLDRNTPLDESLARQADLIVTCHPELLPPAARAKHIFPDHTGDVEVTWRNGGRDITVAPVFPEGVVPAGQNPRLDHLRAAMRLEKEAGRRVADRDPEAIGIQDYAAQLRRAAMESTPPRDLQPRRFERTGMSMVARAEVAPQDVVMVNGAKLHVGPEQEISIGRNPGNKLLFDDTNISRNHAKIGRTQDGRLYVRDDGSSNGTFVRRPEDGNWQRLKPGENKYLRPTDEIRLTGEGGPILKFSIEPRLTNSDVARVNGIELGAGQKLTIGRFADRDIRFPDSDLSVSREHAIVHRTRDGRVVITDTSSFGTFVNGRQIPRNMEYELRPGDQVVLGRNGAKLDLDVMHVRQAPDAVRNKLAIDQSNEYATKHEMARPLEPGFQNGGASAKFDAQGRPSIEHRAITVFDPARDTVLRNSIDYAHRMFGGITDQLTLMRKLNAYAHQLLTPPHMKGGAIDAWYDAFNNAHAGKQVLLGQFITEGKGVCSQQAFLLKVLADSFGLDARMVRGLKGQHAWVTMDINGQKHIFDTRNIHLADGRQFDVNDRNARQYVTGYAKYPSGPFGRGSSRIGFEPSRGFEDGVSEYRPRVGGPDANAVVHRADSRDLAGHQPELDRFRAAADGHEGRVLLSNDRPVLAPGAKWMSNNSWDMYKSRLRATDEELGPGRVVLDVGSGARQEIARHARENNTGAKVISVDPRLSWPAERDLHPDNFPVKGKGVEALIEARRQGRANPEPHTIAEESHNMRSVANNSVDTIYANLSVPMYISGDRDKISKTFSEFVRVLKPGGNARIYPIEKNLLPQVLHELDGHPVSYHFDEQSQLLTINRLNRAEPSAVRASISSAGSAPEAVADLRRLQGHVYEPYMRQPNVGDIGVERRVMSTPQSGPVGYSLVDARARNVSDVVVKPGFGRQADQLFDDLISQMRRTGGTWNLRFGESAYWLQDYLRQNRDRYGFRIEAQSRQEQAVMGNSYTARITFGN